MRELALLVALLVESRKETKERKKVTIFRKIGSFSSFLSIPYHTEVCIYTPQIISLH